MSIIERLYRVVMVMREKQIQDIITTKENESPEMEIDNNATHSHLVPNRLQQIHLPHEKIKFTF
ncbi:25713_t:CDS:2 [Dentiscutata erythropus]|uniref:25713_t:CDS:1 n=1 Tax=Dentiscutata erythropus TaxID=1348616 RepID=A0A9N8ZJ94_9GLOM|nr:25713_t:CDS:2 [Dentiscutata erythropus]